MNWNCFQYEIVFQAGWERNLLLRYLEDWTKILLKNFSAELNIHPHQVEYSFSVGIQGKTHPREISEYPNNCNRWYGIYQITITISAVVGIIGFFSLTESHKLFPPPSPYDDIIY